MPSPYATPEISQTGDPSMGQVGAQNANVNDNLYAASYPGAPGRTADASPTSGGSDLATQGLSRLQQGDQYGGIMTLLEAAQQSPQSVQNPAFLQQLQIVESSPAAQSATSTDSSQLAAPTDSSQFTAPTDSPAYGATSDTTAMNPQLSAAQQTTDGNQIANQALSLAQSNPTEGILGLMQAATVNPDLVSDQNFLTTMGQVLPQGAGADATMAQAQQQPTTDASQQVQAQPGMDASQQVQAQPGTDASQQVQPQAGTDASQQVQAQPGTDASQQQVPTTDASQVPTAAPSYTMPAQLTSSGDPQIEAGIKQAFQLIQGGDQFDGARLLMMIAKADPSILKDQAFIQNFTNLEQAVQSASSSTPTDQTAAQSQQQQQQQYDAQGNPIAQPGAQTTDAQGNPIAQPGAQAMTDAQGNPIAQPSTQQMMVDAQGNPVATDAQGMPTAQANPQSMTMDPSMMATAPSDTQTAPISDPSSIGAPAS